MKNSAYKKWLLPAVLGAALHRLYDKKASNAKECEYI